MATHTELTLQNFAKYAIISFIIGLVTIGFSIADLLMIGFLGEVHVAAVGLGDLIITFIFAGTVSFVDIFSSRLANFEGSKVHRSEHLGLALGFLYSVALCTVLALILRVMIEPSLVFFRQVDELIKPVSGYVNNRLLGIAPFLIYMAASEALRISGQRTHALYIFIFGFIINILLNACFLYTNVSVFFSTPEAAVAIATVIAHTFMGVIATILWLTKADLAKTVLHKKVLRSANNNFFFLIRTAPGIGVRLLNDYSGAILPLLFIGTMDVRTVAAASIATKVYTLFCRVPQAALSASYIYYSYGLSEHMRQPVSEVSVITVRRLFKYTAWPTLIVLTLTLSTSISLIQIIGSGAVDVKLTQDMLLAYLLFVPFYIIEQFYAELLTAHNRSAFLFGVSTAVTYLITIPLAYISVFFWKSALFAIAVKGVSVIILSIIYWRQYQQRWNYGGSFYA